jgi:predicted transcriptional regulator
MKRVTVYLPEEIDATLTRLAQQQNTSKSALIRQAVVALVNGDKSGEVASKLPAWVGSVSHGGLDDVEMLDACLHEMYEASCKEFFS